MCVTVCLVCCRPAVDLLLSIDRVKAAIPMGKKAAAEPVPEEKKEE